MLSGETSIRLNAGLADDLPPHLHFVDDVHTEILGRTAEHLRPFFFQAITQLGIRQDGNNIFVKKLNNRLRRARRCHQTVPVTDVESRERFGNRRKTGKRLCPFARPVQMAGRIRYVATHVRQGSALADVLADELERLASADTADVETTLIVHPDVLQDFLDYNDFLDVADALVEDMELDGIVQVASFHPRYQFEGTSPDDIGNYSNRSPYPTLHLLREESVERAVATHPDVASIPHRNIATLERLGIDGWKKLGVDAPE